LGVLIPLCFEYVIQLRDGEGRIPSEELGDVHPAVTFDHGLQYSLPVVGTGDIATAQQRSLNIPVLIEEEQRVVALTFEVAVVGRAFLLAIGRADRAVHVEDQLAGWTPLADSVHPFAGHRQERVEVVRVAQHVCLKTGHLARGGSVPIHGTPSDDVTHDGIDPQPFGVVDIFIACQAAVDGLT